MLINTLFLFLLELLPLFLFSALVVSVVSLSPFKSALIIRSYLIGFGLGLLLITAVDYISMAFDGRGLELFMFSISFIQVFSFTLYLYLGSPHRHAKHLIAVVMILITMTTSVNFLSYFTVLWQSQGASQALLLGAIIGAGFSASLAVLLYFFVMLIEKYMPLISLFITGVFLTGQLANKTNLLAQIGLIDGEVFWSTEAIFSEQTVVGHVLRSLVGYEATPIHWQVYTYIFVLLILSLILIYKKPQLMSAIPKGEVSK